jgi:hypothetical protein
MVWATIETEATYGFQQIYESESNEQLKRFNLVCTPDDDASPVASLGTWMLFEYVGEDTWTGWCLYDVGEILPNGISRNYCAVNSDGTTWTPFDETCTKWRICVNWKAIPVNVQGIFGIFGDYATC